MLHRLLPLLVIILGDRFLERFFLFYFAEMPRSSQFECEAQPMCNRGGLLHISWWCDIATHRMQDRHLLQLTGGPAAKIERRGDLALRFKCSGLILPFFLFRRAFSLVAYA